MISGAKYSAVPQNVDVIALFVGRRLKKDLNKILWFLNDNHFFEFLDDLGMIYD